MTLRQVPTTTRRAFVRWLTMSPVLAVGHDSARAAELALPVPISEPGQALNVMDFEPVARASLSPAHWTYLASGVDDEMTLQANRAGFARFAIRARRLVDVHDIDTTMTLFGEKWSSPVFLAPIGSERAFHPDGVLAAIRAARANGNLHVMSTYSSASIEEANAVSGRPVWYQIYPTDDWELTRAQVARVSAAGCRALVLTVDLQGGSNRETAVRGRQSDGSDCTTCHAGGFSRRTRAMHRPMFQGLDLSRLTANMPLTADWQMVQRLRDLSQMKLLIKGIVTGEDAALAVRYGIDGIIVSNHGGRAEESGRSAIAVLPEAIDAVGGHIPVLVDGGFRRGTDIFKALALGAAAIGIGRPYVWGLAAFGEAGVHAVLQILQRELEMIMRQAGTISLDRINRHYIQAMA